jgi:Bacterial Ig-like domain (group 3)/FG-GAP-like repeat
MESHYCSPRLDHSPCPNPAALSRSFLYVWFGVAELLALVVLLGGPFALAGPAPTATTTTLTVSPSSVSAGTVVTFTASVSNGSPVTPGLVTFCDATDTYCEDSAIIGTAQLTSAGTAVIRMPPPIGSHSYKAVFNGTTSNTKSTSLAQSLTVTGTHATTTAISASGSTGNYTLTGTVVGTGIASPPPTGSVSFVDTTNSYTLGSAALGSAITAQALGTLVSYGVGLEPTEISVGDFNGDGLADLAVVNWGDNTVSILLGNDDGTFQPKITYPTGVGPAGPSR